MTFYALGEFFLRDAKTLVTLLMEKAVTQIYSFSEWVWVSSSRNFPASVVSCVFPLLQWEGLQPFDGHCEAKTLGLVNFGDLKVQGSCAYFDLGWKLKKCLQWEPRPQPSSLPDTWEHSGNSKTWVSEESIFLVGLIGKVTVIIMLTKASVADFCFKE